MLLPYQTTVCPSSGSARSPIGSSSALVDEPQPRAVCAAIVHTHFVRFGPRGSTVSGRQTRKGLKPVVACANAWILSLNRFSQAFFVGKALSLPVSKLQP